MNSCNFHLLYSHRFLKQYLSVVFAVNETLVGYSIPSHLPFTGRWMGLLDTTMEHLACFYPGLLALGLSHGLHPEQAALAGRLAESCYMMYKHTPTGLAAEVTLFNTQRGSTEDLAVMVGICTYVYYILSFRVHNSSLEGAAELKFVSFCSS